MSDRGIRRTLIGQIVSDKMDKTVVVEVTRRFQHAMYKKYISRRKRYKAHDEENQYQSGDTVELVESRPISKDKRWRVARLIEKGVRL
jgi:small subunit ribosomal protein S17